MPGEIKSLGERHAWRDKIFGGKEIFKIYFSLRDLSHKVFIRSDNRKRVPGTCPFSIQATQDTRVGETTTIEGMYVMRHVHLSTSCFMLKPAC